ncbi:MAG: glycosyltransferase family 1 protein [Bacteroidota bacterium]
MAAKYLHIVSFNIPYPADYGGIIDIFYKLKALKQVGIQIILHCFEYGRQHSKELEDLCFKVYYYPRKRGLKYFLSSDPYIVATRSANSMPNNLLKDSFPVLFEGLHTTGFLIRCRNANKKILVRAHNIEHLYYRALSKSEPNLYRKLFLRSESEKLRRYEQVLSHADHILGIAKHETIYFNNSYGNALFVPAFHRFEEVLSLPGSGEYILFHGNLGVPENSEVFLNLASESLSRTPYPVVVAGKNPSERFLKKIARYPQIKVVANPTDQELDELILNAHVNLLQTLQSTGIKLKLLHALFSGRHCLVNAQMVEGTGLDQLCSVTNSKEEVIPELNKLMGIPFGDEQIKKRKKALKEFSNRAGAEKILRLIS